MSEVSRLQPRSQPLIGPFLGIPKKRHDDLNAIRGFLIGTVIGLSLWAALFGAWYWL